MTAIAIYEEPRTATVEETVEGTMVKTHGVVIVGWVVAGLAIKALVCDEGEFSDMGSNTRMVPAEKVRFWYGPKDAM